MMTQEEQQAYFEKQRQESLNNCCIKTQEQFIEECRKANIQDDWYAFTEDKSKPVCMKEYINSSVRRKDEISEGLKDILKRRFEKTY